MTGREIRNAAEIYVGHELEDDIVLTAINEAVTLIGDFGFVHGTITIESESNEEHYLPSDITNVITVFRGNQEYEGWRVIGDSIFFGEEGTYTIRARRIPSRLANLDEELDTNVAYHNAVLRYVRAFALQASSDDPGDKRHRFDSFEETVVSIHNRLNRSRQPKTVKVIRHA